MGEICSKHGGIQHLLQRRDHFEDFDLDNILVNGILGNRLDGIESVTL
jgi:hypothetical protein